MPEMRVLRDLGLTTKFLLGVGIIIILFWCLFNILIYTNLKGTVIEHTYEKTDMLFTAIEATQRYVRETLRPKLFHVLPEGEFVLEGMSVSFVTRNIMENFKEDFPEFRYRRVSINPRNPANRATSLEEKYIKLFREKGLERYQEIVTLDGQKYYIQARPIVLEQRCMQCHGRPEDAPREIIEKYGTKGGFYETPGEVIGVDSVAIPLEGAFSRISQIVLSIFMTGLVGVFFLFITLNYYINRVAVRPIKRVSRFFKSVVEGEKGLNARFEVRTKDEIGELAEAFNQMMRYLRESQERLRVSETKYRRIFEGSKDTIVVADCDGFIEEINPSGLELFGCKSKERLVREKTLYDLFEDRRAYSEFVNQMKVKGFVKDYETTLVGVDDRKVDVLITATLRYDEKDQFCGYEAIIKDITGYKQLQRQMVEAERLASLGQLAAGVAHEINNPLGIIMGYTGMLLSEDGLPQELKEDLRAVYKNAEACKRIVEDLLKFSRQSPSRPEPTDLNQLVEEVITLLLYQIEEKEIILEKRLEDVPSVMVDPDKIRQVIMNILLNAIQAVQRKGIVRIRTCYEPEGEQVCLEVSDTGHGIPEEHLSRIFEPFFTTKPPGEGTGLGLAISYGIVKEHGGQIRVDSSVGRGSTFTVCLPVAPGHTP